MCLPRNLNAGSPQLCKPAVNIIWLIPADLIYNDLVRFPVTDSNIKCPAEMKVDISQGFSTVNKLPALFISSGKCAGLQNEG